MNFKEQLSSFDIKVYVPQHLEEVVELLTESYLTNDPFIKPMKFTREELKNDFTNQLLENVYNNSLLLVDKVTKEIAACTFFTSLSRIKINMEADITKIPNRKLTKQYLRDAIISKLLMGKNLDLDKIYFGSNFAVKRKYQSQGLGNLVQYCVVTQELLNGRYEMLVGTYINEQVKYMAKRNSNVEDSVHFDLDNVMILENSERPFQGLGLKYEAYLFVRQNQSKL